MTHHPAHHQHHRHHHPRRSVRKNLAQTIGLGLIALSLGGLVGPLFDTVRLETAFRSMQVKQAIKEYIEPTPIPLPPAVPELVSPLIAPDGTEIMPENDYFALIVPSIGINAGVIPMVNPLEPADYLEALESGVAHSSLSYLPDEDGTVYLFSHSTNYEWFVQDLNAVFYHLKNLSEGNEVVLVYKGKNYTYRVTRKEIVPPDSINYLIPQSGHKSLILQTCWPPGTVDERMLVFADFVE